MKNIVLCPNPGRDRDLSVTSSVKSALEELGALVTVRPYLEVTAGDIREADAVITFGGDGTILRTARVAAGTGVPLLGVNLGNKGFIAELERDNALLATRLMSGEYSVEERMMADVTVTRDGGTVYSDFALNDIFVGGIRKMVDVTVYGDGKKLSAFSGDGLVIATPTGSTAYSLSAGGPIVEPDAENLIVTPICPHVLWAKAYVLAANRVVTVELGKIRGNIAYLSTDGSDPIYLSSHDTVTVKRSELKTRLIKLTDMSFYERVSEKLGEK